MIRLAQGEYFGSPTSLVTVAGLQITEAAYAPQTRVPRHSHDQPYLCLVTSGGFEERSRNHAALCGPGAVLWHPSGEVHEDAFGSHGGACMNIAFREEWVPRLETFAARSWTYARGRTAAWLAGRIQYELSAADSASSLAVEGLVCALLAEVSRSSPNSGSKRPAWLDRAVSRMRMEYRGALTLAELAAEAGVHRSTFVRSFHRHVGCSVGEFIRRLRIDWAAEELRRADGPRIADLSLLAGFSDQAHFTRTFKQVTGQTPAQFRARSR